LLPAPLLLADLDGTLLDQSGVLDSQAFDALVGVVHERGGQVVIATARPPHDVARLLGQTRENFLAICSDGALVVECRDGAIVSVTDERFLSRSVAVDAVSSLQEAVTDSPVLAFGGSADGFVIRISARSEGDARRIKAIMELLGDERPVEVHATAASAVNMCVRALALLGSEEALTLARNHLGASAPGRQVLYYRETRLRVRDLWWLDVIADGVSKGAAARRVCDSWTRGPIVAVGNAANDVSLFRAAHLSLCPSDADDIARGAVNQVLDAPGGPQFITAICNELSRLGGDPE
jgi:HAD superfamily hydrolase (TIGR01484 family)